MSSLRGMPKGWRYLIIRGANHAHDSNLLCADLRYSEIHRDWVSFMSAVRERLFALGRLKSGTMNKTEQRYAQHLELLKHAGEVLWYKFEGMKFKIADACFYEPDFSVLMANGQMQMHEVKGSKAIFQDDAKIKIKAAAEMYPLVFKAVFPTAKNSWEELEF